MPGPPKTPRAFKVLSGQKPSKIAAGFEEAPEFPVVEPGAFPGAPQHLNPDGAEMWNGVGAQLVACGVVQVVDLYALEELAYAWQNFRQKAKAGMEVTASEHNALKGLLQEFGLTPAARRRVVANITEPPKQNRFRQFGHSAKPETA